MTLSVVRRIVVALEQRWVDATRSRVGHAQGVAGPMTIAETLYARQPHTPVPRGLAQDGPAILSYGFRPFFMAAGVWAVMAMALWLGAILKGWPVGGSYGAINWHAHEMLFGYASAALAGFMLTAVPNWTGRLPVSGRPLLVLVLIWCAGRMAMLMPDAGGLAASAIIESLFLPALAFVAGREIVSGRNWKNLKILAALVTLSMANVSFHAAVLTGFDSGYAYRGTIAALLMLIALVGGRIVPSFTRNWLAKRRLGLPAPFDRVDQAALIVTGIALLSWTIKGVPMVTAGLCLAAAALQALRLWRWRGWLARSEPIVLILHVAYVFIPLGLLAIVASTVGWTSEISSLHLFTVGAIGLMTLAVMTRATLGHTGRAVAASGTMCAAYAALIAAALFRPAAEAIPELYTLLLTISAILWLFAFGAFLVACGPMLVSPRLRS
jgi:uncharacterized protein involved in response to NO